VTAQQLLTILGSILGVLVFFGGIGATLVLLGRRYGEVSEIIKSIKEALTEVKSHVEELRKIPTLEKSVEFIASATARNTSDIKGLIAKEAHMRGRLDSADFNGSGNGGGPDSD
jgi:lipid A disaccharide synthetase